MKISGHILAFLVLFGTGIFLPFLLFDYYVASQPSLGQTLQEAHLLQKELDRYQDFVESERLKFAFGPGENKVAIKKGKKDPNALYNRGLKLLGNFRYLEAAQFFLSLDLEGGAEYAYYLAGQKYDEDKVTLAVPAFKGNVPDELNAWSQKKSKRVKRMRKCFNVKDFEDWVIPQCNKRFKDPVDRLETSYFVRFRYEGNKFSPRTEHFCRYGLKFNSKELTRRCTALALRFLQFDEAIEFQKAYVELEKTIPNYEKLARYMVLNETYQDLIDYFETRIKKGVKSFRILNYTGQSYFFAKDFANALLYFKQARAYNLKNAEVHNNIALCYYSLEQDDKAIQFFEQALKLKPNYPKVMKRLLGIYKEKGMDDKAKALIQKIKNLKKKPGA